MLYKGAFSMLIVKEATKRQNSTTGPRRCFSYNGRALKA